MGNFKIKVNSILNMNSNFRTVPFADTDPQATNEIVRANTMLEDMYITLDHKTL